MFSGNSSDQPATPDSAPNNSAATNSGGSPGGNSSGFIPRARSADGKNILVEITDRDKFDEAVQDYKDNHDGENPVVGQGWTDWNDFFDSGGRLYVGPNFVYPERYIKEHNDMTILHYGGKKSWIRAKIEGKDSKSKIEMLADALDLVYVVPGLREEMVALMNTRRSDYLIYINDQSENYTSVNTGTITWNSIREINGASAFVSLGHEIHHAFEYIKKTIKAQHDYIGKNPSWEMGALRAENIIRGFYGFTIRRNYTDDDHEYHPGEEPIPMITLPPLEVH